MNFSSLTPLLIFSLFLFSQEGWSQSGLDCRGSFQSNESSSEREPFSSSENIWKNLRLKGRLIDQGLTLSDIGEQINLCGPTCVLNVAEAVSASVNRMPLPAPKSLLEEIAKELKGRGSNIYTMLYTMDFVFERYGVLPDLEISTQMLRGPADPSRKDSIQFLDSIGENQIEPGAREFKILLVWERDRQNRIGEAHGLIVETFTGQEVKIIDPNFPLLSFRAKFNSHQRVGNFNLSYFEYLSLVPNRVGFMPFGVITIALK